MLLAAGTGSFVMSLISLESVALSASALYRGSFITSPAIISSSPVPVSTFKLVHIYIALQLVAYGQAQQVHAMRKYMHSHFKRI